MPEDRGCAEYAHIGRIIAGYRYATLIHRPLFGDNRFTLNGAGEGEWNVCRVEFGEEWVEENVPEIRFGLSGEDMVQVLGHLGQCVKRGCAEAGQRLLIVQGLQRDETRAMRRLKDKLIAMEGYPTRGPFELRRGQGFDGLMDTLAPVMGWYTPTNEDFVLPGEWSPRLEGRVAIGYSEGNESLWVGCPRGEGGNSAGMGIYINFGNVRKLRVEGSAAWRSPRFYHMGCAPTGYEDKLEYSSPSAETQLELMAEGGSVEELVGRVVEATCGALRWVNDIPF